jgi:hypothetical protein
MTDLRALEQERLQLLREWSANQARSKQTTLGRSEIGHDCTRYVWNATHGVPAVNPDQHVLASMRGTAFHTLLEGILGPAGWSTEVYIEGDGMPGRVDLLRDGTVEDSKTGDADKARALRSYGPNRQRRWQVHLYGKALEDAGHEVHTVRITLYALDSSDEIAMWQEPYSREVAEEALAYRDRIATQEEPPAPGKDPEWCSKFCKFYDAMLDKGGCPSRLLGDDVPELTDPELVAAVNDMRDAREGAKKAAERKAAASSVLYGLRGTVGEFQVRTVQREGSTSVDVDAVDWDAYEAIVGAVPYKTSSGSSYVSISRAKRAKR